MKRKYLYQAPYLHNATWSQGTMQEFLRLALEVRRETPNREIVEIRVKVGDPIPPALAPHAGRPILMMCKNDPLDGALEWVCKVY